MPQRRILMARQSIFGDKREEVKAWLQRRSKQKQAEGSHLHLSELCIQARRRWPQLLPDPVYGPPWKASKGGKKKGKLTSGKSDDSVIQALYRILAENGIWFGYHGTTTKSQVTKKSGK
jgi:hypothetical protein